MGASKLCKTCNVVHFEPAVYKRWLSLYSGTGKLGEQVVRWAAIVEKHTRKGPAGDLRQSQ